MNTIRLHAFLGFVSFALLTGCSSMPTAEDINGVSDKLKSVIDYPKTVLSKQGKTPKSNPRNAPTIDEPLKRICDTVSANPVTGIENYFKKRLSVRGVIKRISQNYINDYSVSIRSPEGIPVFLEITDRNVIRGLQMNMDVEVTGSVGTVGNRATTSAYKGCSILLSDVDITPLQ